MKAQPKLFRDFGIVPSGVPPLRETVRCYLPWGHVFGQYLGTVVVSGGGAFIAIALGRSFEFPASLLAAAIIIAWVGWTVYFATRCDYAWVELDGSRLRAQHLYTRRVIERSIEDIDDALTLVFIVRNEISLLAEALIGRVRGVEIRFRDKRTPIRILRADPAMTHARELIEAIVYRMSEIGEVDAEIIDFAGKPLVWRIYWK